MLIRFSFKNFKSFKFENCLDMEATKQEEHEYNVARTESGNYLRVSAIYGANASGKTNVLQAFEYMKNRVLISDDSRKKLQIKEENIYAFMINNEPIAVEVEILAKNNKIYKYGFEVLKDEIISEWLYERKDEGFRLVFERENSKIKMVNHILHQFINSDGPTTFLSSIDKTTLFLNLYSKIDRNNTDFSSVYDWFVNSNYLDLGNPNFERAISNRVSLKILSDESYKNELIRFMKTFDGGIEGIKTTPDSIEAVKGDSGSIDIEIIRRGENGELKALPFYLESNGTRKMFHLFDFFVDALKKGIVLFVDELDAKLHPLLTRHIINLFHNEKTNVANGQLIYSTHDTVNLNKATFRKDEIWFTEKDRDGISKLYALSDYILDDKNDTMYSKDYLTGRYGAIPVLEEFEVINEK